jgi:hypothetical protein
MRMRMLKKVGVPRIHKIALCSLLACLLFSIIGYGEEARGESESTQQVIEFLIGTVDQSHLTFIRNGENHTCSEAAMHVRQKYDYFQSKIKSPEDFICICASKSMLSGNPYLVETEQGKIPVEKWLSEKLAEHVKSQKHS